GRVALGPLLRPVPDHPVALVWVRARARLAGHHGRGFRRARATAFRRAGARRIRPGRHQTKPLRLRRGSVPKGSGGAARSRLLALVRGDQRGIGDLADRDAVAFGRLRSRRIQAVREELGRLGLWYAGTSDGAVARHLPGGAEAVREGAAGRSGSTFVPR